MFKFLLLLLLLFTILSSKEPMGVYQAQIARTLNEGDVRKSSSQSWVNQDVTSDEDEEPEVVDDESTDLSLEQAARRLAHLNIRSGLRAKRHLFAAHRRKTNKVSPGGGGVDSLSPMTSNDSNGSNNNLINGIGNHRMFPSLHIPIPFISSDRSSRNSKTSEDVLAVTTSAASDAMSLLHQFEVDTNARLLHQAQESLREINEPDAVAIPNFRPAIDFVPIPGRMRLRVSNDYGYPGVTEHRLRSLKWGIEDLYVQKSKDDPKYDAFMQVLYIYYAFLNVFIFLYTLLSVPS
jgi:hypothetical protein